MVLTHVVAIFLLLQTVLMMSEILLRVLSLQPTCSPVAHADDGDSMQNNFPLFTLSVLALCYASCKEYFLSLDQRCNKLILCCDITL